MKLTHASSGVQSALPLCLVSEDLTNLVLAKTEVKHTKEEKARLEKQIAEMLANPDTTDTMRNILQKQLSTMSRYGSFINIAEEPELNNFPKSQYEVVLSLVKDCLLCDQNLLVTKTHSPYILVAINLLILAGILGERCNNDFLDEIIPRNCHITSEKIGAFCMQNENGKESSTSLINKVAGLIDKNELDSISGEIT